MGIPAGPGRRPGRRRAALAAAAACLLAASLLAADLTRRPAHQVSSRAALSAIRWYQSSLSPHLGGQCRFTPTCSVYATTAIERHGALKGGWMAARRVVRCGPWTRAGTVDRPK